METVALLYNIRSLHNVGSIFRTTDAAGVKKLYLCGITPTPLDRFGNKRRELTKVSLGTENSVAWEKIGGSPRPQATISLIKKLKEERFVVCSIEQDKKSVPYNNFTKIRGIRANLRIRVALIVGDEIRGLPSSILNASDYILEIPMHGKKESLNVSVAFGIVAYELTSGQNR
jgi:23S rRNA (guanosine2251-2'-O)-methyltransferase